MILELLDIINRSYGDYGSNYLPAFVRRESIYSHLLIISLTFEELEFLLLEQRNYELIPKTVVEFTSDHKEIEEKIRSIFGNNIDLPSKNNSLLSLIKTDDKDLFWKSFNKFEFAIYDFLLEKILM